MIRKFKMIKIIFVMISVLFILFWVMLNLHFKPIIDKYMIYMDFKSYEDGQYIGTYNYNDALYATVEVIIENGKLVEIELIEHKTGFGKKAKDIINSVLKKQSTKVDLISGATYSSKVILLSIEKALED